MTRALSADSREYVSSCPEYALPAKDTVPAASAIRVTVVPAVVAGGALGT
jgi:hypothetical protein